MNRMKLGHNPGENNIHDDGQSTIADELLDISAKLEQLDKMAQVFLANKRTPDKNNGHP